MTSPPSACSTVVPYFTAVALACPFLCGTLLLLEWCLRLNYSREEKDKRTHKTRRSPTACVHVEHPKRTYVAVLPRFVQSAEEFTAELVLRVVFRVRLTTRKEENWVIRLRRNAVVVLVSYKYDAHLERWIVAVMSHFEQRLSYERTQQSTSTSPRNVSVTGQHRPVLQLKQERAAAVGSTDTEQWPTLQYPFLRGERNQQDTQPKLG